MHEASLYEENSFITLTFSNTALPGEGKLRARQRDLVAQVRTSWSLEYRLYQAFMKRLRRKFAPRVIRFFMGGEYGEERGRPHFHACVFNCGFADRVRYRRSNGRWLYRSPTLEKLWPFGYSTIGEVTFESAAYVARYCCSKITGPEACGWYQRVDEETGEVFDLVPEFGHMSLKPSIGKDWMRLYWPEVARQGTVVVGGREMRAPKMYELMIKHLERFEDVEFRRAEEARRYSGEFSPERLAVQEVVTKARLNQKRRGNSL